MSRRSTDGPERIVIPFHPARKSKDQTQPVGNSDGAAKGTERRVGQRRDHGSGASQPPLAPLVETILKQQGEKPASSAPRTAAKLADLNPEERDAYGRSIDFYRYVGKPDTEVVSLAWSDLQLAFPRLQKFDGPKALAHPA